MKIVISSFDQYSDIWPVFFKCKENYWKCNDYEWFLVSNKKKYITNNCKNILTGEEINWCDRMEKALKLVDDKYILLLLEDYLFGDYVDQEKVWKCVKFCEEKNANYLRLIDIPHSKHLFGIRYKKAEDGFYCIPQNEEYGINLQPAIWKKEYLLDVLKNVGGSRSAWEVECHFLRKTEKANGLPLEGCYTTSENILNIHNGVLKGKWFPNEVRYFRKRGIYIDETRATLGKCKYIRYRVKLLIRESLTSTQRKKVKCLLRKVGVSFASDSM